MGKRVSVKRPKAPQLNLSKIKHGAETQILAFGVGIVCFAWLMAIMVAFFFAKKDNRPLVVLIGWPIASWVVMLIAAGGHRAKIVKRFPRSKVTGTAFSDVRIQIHQLCRLLDIKKTPDTYIVDSGELAATVRGAGSPYLVISSRLLEVLDDREQSALFAVLLGHIRAGTVFWRTFIMTMNEVNPLVKLLCLPWYLVATLAKPYLEASYYSADRVALLALHGDYHFLVLVICKVLAMTSESLNADRVNHLMKFLTKDGVEARAEDVENLFVLNQMKREIPGLEDRWENITSTPSLPKFQEQLAIMEERINMLQPVR